MSLIGDRTMKVFAVLLVAIFTIVDGRPQSEQQSYIPTSSQSEVQVAPNRRQTFYVPPVEQQQQQSTSASSYDQQQQQQQFFVQPPIQLQIPIPNDDVEEKKIYVQLPPQQYPQQPQYRYPPRKHYKIILIRSQPQPTPPPAPVLPEIEEQTLVYVLVKKPDSPSTAELEQLQQQQQQSYKLNKPEVYFIKYKANEQKTDGSISSIPSEAIEKSIEQQLSNNVEGDDTTNYRESKNLKQDDDKAEKVVEVQ